MSNFSRLNRQQKGSKDHLQGRYSRLQQRVTKALEVVKEQSSEQVAQLLGTSLVTMRGRHECSLKATDKFLRTRKQVTRRALLAATKHTLSDAYFPSELATHNAELVKVALSCGAPKDADPPLAAVSQNTVPFRYKRHLTCVADFALSAELDKNQTITVPAVNRRTNREITNAFDKRRLVRDLSPRSAEHV